MMTSGCPTSCLVNCDDSRYSPEISKAFMPGFMALCGDVGGFHDHVACLFQNIGKCVGSKVCDTLHVYETGLDEDAIHLRKRKTYCTDAVMKIWTACKDKMDEYGYSASKELTACLKENGTLGELIELKEALGLYGK